MHTDLDEQYDKIYRYCYMKLRHQQKILRRKPFSVFWKIKLIKIWEKKSVICTGLQETSVLIR